MRIFLSVFILLSCITTLAISSFAEPLKIGQAAVVRGQVQVERDGNTLPLKARDSVYQDDRILTGGKAKVQIIFVDDTIFTIGREAEILLDKYVYDPATHNGESEVEAKKGTFKFVTGKIAKKDPKQVKVKTPFATIGVRGSGGVIGVEPNGATTVGLTQCCLDVFANGAPPGTPPIALDDVNSFSEVRDPNSPPTPPLPMPPNMRRKFNGDLGGGFGEGDEDFLSDDDSDLLGDEDGDPTDAGDEGDAGDEEGDDQGSAEGEGDGTEGQADGEGGGDGQEPVEDGGTEGDGGDQGSAEGEEGGDNPTPLDEGASNDGTEGPADGEPLAGDDGSAPPPPEEGGDQQFVEGDGSAPPPPPPGDDGGFTGTDGGFIDDGGLAGGDDFGTFGTEGGDLLGGEDLAGDFNDPLLTDGTETTLIETTTTDSVDTVVDVTQTTQDNTNTTTSDTSTAPTTHTGIFKRKIAGSTNVLEGDLTGSLSGGQLLGTFTDFNSNVFSGALPIPATVGDFAQPGFGFDGVIFSGAGYRSDNSDFLLYDLNNASGDKLYVAAGTEILVPTSGVNTFQFRDDPFRAGAGSSAPVNDGDAIVDWGRQKFLGGQIEIFNGSATDYRYGTTVGFGDVFSTPGAGGINALGVALDFEQERNGGTIYDPTFAYGTASAFEVFGTGTDVSGFLLDIDQEGGNLTDGDPLNTTEYTINPLVRVADDPTVVADAAAFTTAKSYRGFVGGYIMKVASDGSAEAYDRISNDAYKGGIDGGVFINLNPGGTANADLTAWTGAGDMYDVDFGYGSTSAAIGEEAYAIEQHFSSINRLNIFAGVGGAATVTATGKAYIFDREDPGAVVWNKTSNIVAPDAGAGDNFGESVDMSGRFAISGASWEDDDVAGNNPLTDAGSAYIYGRNNAGSWNYQQKIAASDRALGDGFGSDVAMNGIFAIVGSEFNDAGGADSGAAYMYSWNGSAWGNEQKLIASDAQASDIFGSSVDIHGNYAVVGAWQEDGGGTDSGAVYVFKFDGTNWNEIQKISGPAALSSFGYDVAIHGDLIVVASPDANVDGGNDDGRVHIYKNNGADTFVEQQNFTAPAGIVNNRFGHYVDVENGLVVVGSPEIDSMGTVDGGMVTVHSFNGSFWEVEEMIVPDNVMNADFFGKDVRISGNTIVAGAIGGDGDVADSGTMYVFERTPAKSFLQQGPVGIVDDLETIKYAGGFWVTGGYNGQLSISSDGQNWLNRTSTFGTGIMFNLENDGTNWVATGRNATTAEISYSSDGNTWNTAASLGAFTTGDTVYGIDDDGTGTLVSVGSLGKAAFSIDNGVNWTAATANPGGWTGNIFDVIYDSANNQWIAVGVSGQFASSSDGGDNWTATNTIASFGGNNINTLATDGTKIVAMGDLGKVAYTTDAGVTWNALPDLTQFSSGNVRELTYANGTWFAVGVSGGVPVIMTSGNGIQWHEFTGNTFSNTVTSIAYNPASEMWIAVGPGGGASQTEVGALVGTEWEEVQQFAPADGNVAGDDFGRTVAFSGAVVSLDDDGALISEALSDIQCTTCQYVHWGVWAGKIQNTELLSQSDSALAQMVPYVAGELTDATTLNSFTGTANYSGLTIGSILDEGANSLSHHHGNFTAAVNFANRDVTFTGDIGGYNMSGSDTALWGAEQNAFNMNITVSGAGAGTGEINGAFFGPNAQDIGGNFEFNGTGFSAAGVYLGNDATR
jgi:hypothetical protein